MYGRGRGRFGLSGAVFLARRRRTGCPCYPTFAKEEPQRRADKALARTVDLPRHPSRISHVNSQPASPQTLASICAKAQRNLENVTDVHTRDILKRPTGGDGIGKTRLTVTA